MKYDLDEDVFVPSNTLKDLESEIQSLKFKINTKEEEIKFLQKRLETIDKAFIEYVGGHHGK